MQPHDSSSYSRHALALLMPPLFDSWPQKNDFGDEALMGPFYRKLKSEVKDELHKVDRPGQP